MKFYNARVAATNRNLEKMVKQGLFREDLYYRLNVVHVHIPSLQERREDIPLLIKHFLQRINKKNDVNREISKKAIDCMVSYPWPGNVRELENIIEMLSVTVPDTTIDIEHLPDKIRSWEDAFAEQDSFIEIHGITTMKKALRETEKKLINATLLKYNGNQQKAADALGVDRSTISRKINHYKIISPDK